MSDINWRKDARIPDVPYRWDTNLDDVALFDFYLIVRQIPEFADYVQSPAAKGFGISIWGDWIPFREGFCWCFGFGDWFYVLYRTALEWELWEANKEELAELKEEQEQEEQAELVRFLDWDRTLYVRMNAALACGNYDQAESILNLRADALVRSPIGKIRELWLYFIPNKAIPSLCKFPTPQPGLRFLDKHDAPYHQYVRFASEYSARTKTDPRDASQFACAVFDWAIARFPNDAFLFKDICLFLQRAGEWQAAIKYCKEAIQRGLKDESTKTGFLGRLKRLSATPKGKRCRAGMDEVEEWKHLAKLNERGDISRAEYRRMRELESADAQTIMEEIACIFDNITSDVIALPEIPPEREQGLQ